jgi:hypothetical protein
MFSLSDIIDTKQRLIDHYNSPEYIDKELAKGRTYTNIRLEQIDRDIALSELIIELAKQEITATSTVNIEERG